MNKRGDFDFNIRGGLQTKLKKDFSANLAPMASC